MVGPTLIELGLASSIFQLEIIGLEPNVSVARFPTELFLKCNEVGNSKRRLSH